MEQRAGSFFRFFAETYFCVDSPHKSSSLPNVRTIVEMPRRRPRKTYWLPVTHLTNTEAAKILMKRWHLRRMFECLNTDPSHAAYHRKLANSIQTQPTNNLASPNAQARSLRRLRRASPAGSTLQTVQHQEQNAGSQSDPEQRLEPAQQYRKETHLCLTQSNLPATETTSPG